MSGLPLNGYVPGQLYPVTVDWPDDMPSVALNVEMTDYDGNAYGELFAADPASVGPRDLCRESTTPDTGQVVLLQPNGRRVLTVAECGQAQTTFVWRAPLLATHGYFSASVVFSNRDSKLAGDHVMDVTRAFGVVGVAPPSVDAYSGGCSASGRSMTPSMDCLAVIFALLAARRRAVV